MKKIYSVRACIFSLTLVLLFPSAPRAEDAGLKERALDLIEGTDCFTCHKVDQRIIGPTYRDVAAKYKDDPKAVEYLTRKVIEGGSGNWGMIPMLPHDDLTQDEAEEIIRWILSL